MAFDIDITAEAERDLAAIKPFYRSKILDDIEEQLQYTPTQVIRTRIKRLRLIESPAYRLRVGDYRVYYDVDEVAQHVTVLRILSKEASLLYLKGLEQ
jgi:mRNA-degrading endonuclease RelE of RelBE toxin-antitoxin system